VNSLAAEVLLGATGGAIGSLLTVPMDVVTIRILTQGADAEKNGGKPPKGFIDMGREVIDTGGYEALLTGWKARVGYWAPAIGIFLSCYCSIRQAAVAFEIFPAGP
jgi:solute carrier family 25 S-adenosylmethionine transporter 26